MSDDADDICFLSTIEQIAHLIGRDKTEALIRSHGGGRVYIPLKADEDHWLSKCVGQRSAQRMCDHFTTGRGVQLELPKSARFDHVNTFDEVARMTDEGFSLDRIARAMNLHTRTISRARSKLNHRRAKFFRDRIKRLLAEGHEPEVIAKAISLPVHSTKMIIAIIRDQGRP